MKNLLPIFTIIVFITTISCSKGVDINSYGSYINNSANGLIQTSICGDITFTSEFKPAEYLAISEIKKHNLEVNDVNYNKALEEKVNTKTFFLKIKSKLQSDFLKDGLKNKDDYYLRLNYYNSEINADISLIQGTDTINCLYSYFQRNFNIGSESTIIIGFEDKHSNKTNEDLRLIVNERALGCGMLDFRIKNEDILKIPQVKI